MRPASCVSETTREVMVSWVVGLAVLTLLAPAPIRAARCGWATDTPLPSNGRFAVVLSGSPKYYVPEQKYRVSVQGTQEGDNPPLKFIGFSLTVEPADDGGSRRRNVGQFTLYGDALAKFDERCANTVTHATFLPTGEVQVLWTAPPPQSGCVVFRAMIQEFRDTWYADDGPPLTVRVCEDAQENLDEQRPVLDPCCACDEAKYEVTFEGLWSRHTHPKDFPADSWVTRFSDVIGASHDVSYRFWEYNGMASEGLRQVAERGSTRVLEAELKAESEHIRTIIKARGISYPNVTGKTFAVFRVDRNNHLMSLVSMIDPSPDWIVGVSGLELCLENCSWAERVQLNLYPFDAGTDSGVTYIEPDQPTLPREPIRKMSSSFPNDLRSPFFDPSGDPMRPLARLSLIRQRLYEKSCSEDPGPNEDDGDGEGHTKEGCEVSEWGAWSACHTTGHRCGSGYRLRQRSYLDPQSLVEARMCSRQLTSRKPCFIDPKVCPGLSSSRGHEDDPECELLPWSSWSSCSTTCGRGTRTRSTRYRYRHNKKRCEASSYSRPLQQNQECFAGKGSPDCDTRATESEPPNGCLLSEWTQFSSCSVTCGNGVQVRTRKELDQAIRGRDYNMDDDGQTPTSGPCAGWPMKETVSCKADLLSCHLLPEQARDVCRLPPEPGPCRATLQRWYFHAESSGCHIFQYGGCRGNRNNFHSQAECEASCRELKVERPAVQHYGTQLSGAKSYSELNEKSLSSKIKNSAKNHGNTTPSSGIMDTSPFGPMESVAHMWVPPGVTYEETPSVDGGVTTGVQGLVVDCKMSQWSAWGPCSATCGTAYKTKERRILQGPQNGGKACPRKLLVLKPCSNLPSCGGHHSPQQDAAYEDHYYGGRDEWDPSENNDCKLSRWSEWSKCSASCGDDARKVRTRFIENHPGPGGAPCGRRVEFRNCNLLPCPQ